MLIKKMRNPKIQVIYKLIKKKLYLKFIPYIPKNNVIRII